MSNVEKSEMNSCCQRRVSMWSSESTTPKRTPADSGRTTDWKRPSVFATSISSADPETYFSAM